MDRRVVAGGCRSWTEHGPTKVFRDIVLMLVDGGHALRHVDVLDQPELFDPVTSTATANRPSSSAWPPPGWGAARTPGRSAATRRWWLLRGQAARRAVVHRLGRHADHRAQ